VVDVDIDADGCSSGRSSLRVINTQSRLLDGASARAALRRVGSALADKRIVFKKIDTGLRGPIGHELAGLMEGLQQSDAPWTCVVAPAAPSIGRTTRDGVQYEHGLHIDQGALADDPDSPPASADIRVVLSRTGGGDYIVADAVCPEDLDRIVESYLPQGRIVFAGSLGLASALVKQITGGSSPTISGDPARRPLLVCGSRHPLSAAQIEQVRNENVRILDFDPHLRRFDGTVGSSWSGVLLVRIKKCRDSPYIGSSSELMASFTEAVVALSEKIDTDGLGIIGGETAYHLLFRLGAHELEVHRRDAEVIACSRIGGGILDGCPLVCKGGSVGPADSVLRMLSLLAGDELTR
jgi:uncharacterized protein YgbK (DUF1537 family)